MARHNGSGDGRKQNSPLIHLSMVPCQFPPQFIRDSSEAMMSDVLRTPSIILVDAGTPKVQSRLYGGVHPDWITGGMWRNTANFIQSVHKFAKDNRHQLVVAFDSSIDDNNLNSWIIRMEADEENIKDVFSRVKASGHPPGNGRVAHQIWFPPTALQTSLRLICISLQITVVGTLFEHEPELVAVPNIHDPTKQSWVDRCGIMFTNSLEYFCYSDVTLGAKALWGESLKLNMRGDRMTGGRIDRTALARHLGIREQSLDAGLLYYGTRYFLDANGFDPIEDLHHQMRDALHSGRPKVNPPSGAVANRLHTVVEMMKEIHKEGVNNENSAKIGDSLVPELKYIKKCIEKGLPLPPHFSSLSRDSTNAEIEAEWTRVRDKASDTFFKVGFRLLDGRISHPLVPYFKDGQRVVFYHQMRFSTKFLERVEKLHRSGSQHEWIGQLIFGRIPSIRIPYTIGDYGRVLLKWRDDPRTFFRNMRRRAYGFLFGATDSSSHSIPFVREIYYGGSEEVAINSISKAIEKVANSAQALWDKDDKPGIMTVILRLVFDDRAPSGWSKGFSDVPDHTWAPVIALRYLIERNPPLVCGGYLDAIIATFACLAVDKTSDFHRKLDDRDRTKEDIHLHVDEKSITFASFFMTAIDHIVFVNDIVGGLITNDNMNPCHYFDGNIFHTKLAIRKLIPDDAQDGVERLMGRNDKKIAMFLSLRDFTLENLKESDLETVLVKPAPATVADLIKNNLLKSSYGAKFDNKRPGETGLGGSSKAFRSAAN